MTRTFGTSEHESLASLLGEVRLLESIVNNLSEGVILSDCSGRFLFFNRIAQSILGLGPVDVPATEWSSLYGCFRPDKITPYPWEELPLTRAIAGERVPETEIFIRNAERPAGVWIAIESFPLSDDRGRSRGGLVVFRDITSERRAQEEIQQLSNAVEQTADGILITDRQGTVEYVNPAFEETTGYKRQEIVGSTPRVLKSGEHDEEFYSKLWKTISSGQVFRGTIVNRKKSGGIFFAEQTITPIKDNGGLITHYVSVMKDVTEQRKLQEQESQLRLARAIQQGYYAVPPPDLEGFDIAGAACPAYATGGDYFDFIALPGGHLGICIGDISGHGFGSALLMAQLRSSLRALSQHFKNAGKVVTLLNQALLSDLKDGRYATLMFCRLNPKTRSLLYTSAGHVPGYLLDGRGRVKRILSSTGIPLGLWETEFTCGQNMTLRPGSILVLLTDGITEADNGDSEFGIERTLAYIHDRRQESAVEIARGLSKSVRAFCGKHPQRDDLTVLICKSL